MAAADRTYHPNESAAYVLPNDAAEQDRLEVQSRAIIATMKDEPFIAPIFGTRPLKKAIDIGCGTGAMTVRLANENPNAKVYGVDLTAVPKIHQMPDNVEFVTGEVRELMREGRKEFQPGTFDYVFSRMLFLGMTDWPGYCKLLFDLLKPGGWAEVQEVGFLMRNASGVEISQDWPWISVMREFLSTKGLDVEVAGKLEGIMKAVGFVDVRAREYIWSWSLEHWKEHPEADEIGRYSAEVLRHEIGRMHPGLYAGSGKSEAELAELREDLARRTSDLPKGSHMRYYAVCGRRPE